MITVNELSLQFNGQKLFSDVNLKFLPGNCYGIIGANGAGKTTFLRILSGELEATSGEIFIDKKCRMSVLKQNHFAFDEYTVLDTVIMGNAHLYEIMQQKDALYMKEDFTEEDGLLAADLENEFAEMGGWEAETEVSRLLQGLGLDANEIMYMPMDSLAEKTKVKILLAQALFGKPDIIMLDEPTNSLDIASVRWLEDFLMDYEGTVIVVSHDRHFLNNVCTHIVDIDYNKIKMYTGNYDFWYDASQLMQRLLKEQNRKAADKIAELESFIRRFSANKSKSRQATSRRKLLEKMTLEEIPASSRRYPFVGFKPDREVGREVLTVEDLTKTIDGKCLLDHISFRLEREDKVAIISENELAVTALFEILMGNMEAEEGSYKWGISTSQSYFPKDNTAYFDGNDMNLIQWISQFSENDITETYLRGFLGRMLFSGDEVYKPVKVLSGGEKVRMMLSRMMMFGSNVLLLDQPTNHLDLESITAVNNGLIDFKGVVIFASQDHQFIESTANRIIEIRNDGSILDRRMNYEEYLEYKSTNE